MLSFIKRSKHLWLVFLLCVTAFSCTSREREATNVDRERQAAAAHVQARDFAPGQLEAHYAKHGAQFGSITMEQYLQQARALLNSSPGNDVQVKTRDNGDFMYFRVSTGEFAVMTRRGRIRTYFKTNIHYWMRQ